VWDGFLQDRKVDDREEYGDLRVKDPPKNVKAKFNSVANKGASHLWQANGKKFLQRCGRILGEDAREGGGKQRGVGIGEDERRAKLNDVLMRPVSAREDTKIAEAVDDVGGLLRGGRAGIAIVYEIEAEKEAGAANIAKEWILGLQRSQSGNPTRTDFQGILLELLVAEYVEDSKSRGAGDRITAKGREKLHTVGERRGNFWSGNDGGERKSVTDGFAENDDVWNDLLRCETPKMSA
jgi:hypothetical protein